MDLPVQNPPAIDLKPPVQRRGCVVPFGIRTLTRVFSRLPNIDNPTTDLRYLRYRRPSQYSSARQQGISFSGSAPAKSDKRGTQNSEDRRCRRRNALIKQDSDEVGSLGHALRFYLPRVSEQPSKLFRHTSRSHHTSLRPLSVDPTGYGHGEKTSSRKRSFSRLLRKIRTLRSRQSRSRR